MISVIITGRNDFHGYNYPKRVAISLNCIAEVLTDPADEIIFADCNSPDHIPTFPEAIADTLSARAKSLLRVLRIRPAQVVKCKQEGAPHILDPVSRNAAVRRSNSANRWILYTTSDMVFVPRNYALSLSQAVSNSPDGFYELPRFELPDGLWERFDRMDPVRLLHFLSEWAQRLHLHEVVYNNEVTLFDNPGDFQLMLREQLFAINGSNEKMLLPWHSDSNLCKRMSLLNGKTSSFLNGCFAYHCTHTRAGAFLTESTRLANDPGEFIFRVADPYLPDQVDWGLDGEELTEIRLSDSRNSGILQVLCDILPGVPEPYTLEPFLPESFNHGLLYDVEHTVPFVASFLTEAPPRSKIAYFGANRTMLRYLGEFLSKLAFCGEILAAEDTLFHQEPEEGAGNLPELVRLTNGKECVEEANLFVFDFGMKMFASRVNSLGIEIPQYTEEAECWIKRMSNWFLACVQRELTRRNTMPPRLFLIIGARNTAVEKFVSRYVGIGPTPHATHVTHGHLRDDVDSNPTVANGVSVDVWRSSPLVEVLEFVRKWTTPDEPILTSNYFVWIRDSAGFHSYYAPLHDWDAYKWAVFAIDDVMRVDPEVLWHIWRLMRPVLANERFVCYSSDPRFQKAPLISRGIGRIFVRLTTPLARMCSWKANLFASTAIKIFQKTVKAAWDIWTSRTAQKLMQTAKYSCSKVQRRIVVVRPTHRLSPGRTCSSKHQ